VSSIAAAARALPPAEEERGRALRRALYVALALNAAVAVAKIAYGRFAHFLAIEADGYHSLTDGLSSIVALVGVGLALRPPDADHPYGHRKFEILAASAIGISLLVLSGNVVADVIAHVRDGTAHTPRVDAGAVVVLLATLAVNFGVSIYQARTGKKYGSAVLLSDARHTRSDCLVTLGVLATAGLAWAGHSELDVVAAAIIAVIIGASGVEILWTNGRYLTDIALVEPRRIETLATSIHPVVAAHSIRTRGTPDAVFLDLRIQVPGRLSVSETHRVSRSIVDAIRHELPSVVDVTIHPEPLEEEK
jgi:cation diffusion facilitator family transporter